MILDNRYIILRPRPPTIGNRQKRWRQMFETSVAAIRLERAINHPLDTDERFAAMGRPHVFVRRSKRYRLPPHVVGDPRGS